VERVAKKRVRSSTNDRWVQVHNSDMEFELDIKIKIDVAFYFADLLYSI
jgi:hypothetical protein